MAISGSQGGSSQSITTRFSDEAKAKQPQDSLPNIIYTEPKQESLAPSLINITSKRQEGLITTKKVHLAAMGTMGTLASIFLTVGLFTLLGIAVTVPLFVPILLLVGGVVFSVSAGVEAAKAQNAPSNKRLSFEVNVDSYENLFDHEGQTTDQPKPINPIHSGASEVHFPPSTPVSTSSEKSNKVNSDPVDIEMRVRGFNIMNNRKKEYLETAITDSEKYKIYQKLITSTDFVINHPQASREIKDKYQTKQRELISEMNKDLPTFMRNVHKKGVGYARSQDKDPTYSPNIYLSKK